MAAGFIYFASTLPGLVKVGRFGSHLTVADKERQYRTLVPGFTIHHAYHVEDDVVAEEARILAHLRLVAGTAVSGAGRENFQLPMAEALKAAGTSVSELESLARATIYALRLGGEGPTIKTLLDEANCGEVSLGNPLADVLARKERLRVGFYALGMHLHAALPDMELDAKVFGIVLYPKKLLKACPELKPCASVLEGLTF